MSGASPMPGPDQELPSDPWLKEALRHAPDTAQQVPPGLADSILRAARKQAQVGPLRSARASRPRAVGATPWWRRPAWAGGMASVVLASVIGLLWLQMAPHAEVAQKDAPPLVAMAPASQADTLPAKPSTPPPSDTPADHRAPSAAAAPTVPADDADTVRSPRPDAVASVSPAPLPPQERARLEAERATQERSADLAMSRSRRAAITAAEATGRPLDTAASAALPSHAPLVPPAPEWSAGNQTDELARASASARAASLPAAAATATAPDAATAATDLSPADTAVAEASAKAQGELLQLRRAVNAQPERWQWRHGQPASPRPIGPAMLGWLAQLDHLSGNAWQTSSAPAGDDSIDLYLDGSIAHRWWIVGNQLFWQRGSQAAPVKVFLMSETVAPRLQRRFDRLR